MGLERKKAVAGQLLIGLEIIQPKARHVRAFLCPPIVPDLVDHPGHQHGQDPQTNHLCHEGRHRRSP